jgi:hypothetical protein
MRAREFIITNKMHRKKWAFYQNNDLNMLTKIRCFQYFKGLVFTKDLQNSFGNIAGVSLQNRGHAQ